MKFNIFENQKHKWRSDIPKFDNSKFRKFRSYRITDINNSSNRIIDQFNQVIFIVTGASVDKEEHNIETMQHNNFISLYFPVHEGFTHIKNDHLIRPLTPFLCLHFQCL